MPDILVQLKTAIEALSGRASTAAAIPVLEGIYRAVDGTLGSVDYLWRESAPKFPREFRGKNTMYGAFASWYWHLSDSRNEIVHDTESPVMDYIALGSPFEGNIFRVAERVTRELIKIRLAQLGYPEAAHSQTNRGVLRLAQRQGLDDQLRLIAPLPT